MGYKVAALWTQKAFRVTAAATWLYSIPLVWMVVLNVGPLWGLLAGFIAAPVLATTIGVLAADKVSRPLAIDWETDVFQRDTSPVVVEAQDTREKELLAA